MARLWSIIAAGMGFFCANATPVFAITDLTFPVPLPSAQVGEAYSFHFTAVNPSSCPLTWALDPSCSPGRFGLAFDTATGTITGTPVAVGTLACRVAAFDRCTQNQIAKPFSLPIVRGCTPAAIVSGPAPNPPFNARYSFTVQAIGTAPLAFGAVGLPPGLFIDPATGVINGIATASGTYNAVVSVENPCGVRVTQALTLVVGAPSITLTLTVEPTLIVVGQTVQITASLSGGLLPPAGRIELCVVGSGFVCAPPLGPSGAPPDRVRPSTFATIDANGNARFTLNGLSIDDYTASVLYAGDDNHSAAAAGPSAFYVIKGILLPPPKVTLALLPISKPGEPLRVQARVSPADATDAKAIPSGNVTLKSNTASLASAPLDATGVAQLAVTLPPTGAMEVFAQYSGDARFPAATSASIKLSPAVVLKDTPANAIPALNGSALAALSGLIAMVAALALRRAGGL